MLRCRQRQCRRHGRVRAGCTLHLCTSLIACVSCTCLLWWAHVMTIRAPAGLELIGRVEVGLGDAAWRRSSALLALCTSLGSFSSHRNPRIVGLGLDQSFVDRALHAHGFRSRFRSRRAWSRTRKRRERIVVAAPLVGAAARACGACRCRACRARIRACRCSTTEGTHDAGMICTSLTRLVGTATDGARGLLRASADAGVVAVAAGAIGASLDWSVQPRLARLAVLGEFELGEGRLGGFELGLGAADEQSCCGKPARRLGAERCRCDVHAVGQTNRLNGTFDGRIGHE